jgi:hypothetical protein
MSHTHTRLVPGHGRFTCVICGELCDPKRQGWTLIKYNIDDRGLPGAFKNAQHVQRTTHPQSD